MYRVIRRFNDRDTGERYEPGQPFACADPGRADHLVSRGFLREEREAPTPARNPLGRFMPGGDSDEGDSP